MGQSELKKQKTELQAIDTAQEIIEGEEKQKERLNLAKQAYNSDEATVITLMGVQIIPLSILRSLITLFDEEGTYNDIMFYQWSHFAFLSQR